ncbi:hypothetical protein ACM26V_04160 [Salipaludibacillus sp. HK11]|uniref:hypothetical protein n=1 Tax=Salipaludibacillus sp. HK11 TaxID=3394320 RepID=UPI0039FD8824
MKNIQIVDGSINSTFDIFEIEDGKFNILSPNNTDISFLEDYPHLINDKEF